MDENALFWARVRELERMDESPQFKEVPRREWETKGISNKTLLWQVPRTTAEILQSIVMSTKPQIILELGTSAGYSGLWMIHAAKEWNATLHTIEFSEYRFKLAQETFSKTKTDKFVVQYNSKILPILKNWEQKNIDLLFIDADKPSYLEHFKIIEPFLTDHATVIADNVLDKKVSDFVDFLDNHLDFSTTIMDVDNGLLVAKRRAKTAISLPLS